MDIALWAAQGLLAFAFIAAGTLKATKTPEELQLQGGERMAWTEDLTPGSIRTIGVLEILGGVGLILPPLVDVLPILAPVAAVGLVLTMLGAMVLHARRKDPAPSFVTNGVLAGLALFVAVGRFGAHAF